MKLRIYQRRSKDPSHHFNITVDNVRYAIEARPFQLNDQMHYKVSINHGTSDILAWDDELGMYRELNDTLPKLQKGLVRAINFKLLDLAQPEYK